MRDFGQRVPSTEEVIEGLTPAVKFRGISPGSTQAAPPAIASQLITFEFNSYELTGEAKEVLNNVGAAFQSEKLSQYKFLIEGHTDSTGSEEYNQRLSELRAEAAKTYLVRRFDIASDRLMTTGKGEQEPLNTDNPASEVNRRVQLINVGN